MPGTDRFEEKSYETAYNVELGRGRGGSRAVFSPGQVLENILGFDAAAAPGATHPLWQVLALPRPSGLSMVPSLWTGGRLPDEKDLPQYPVSIFLQFKRPERRHGKNARMYKKWGGPYFLFSRSAEQHRVLKRLEKHLQGSAVVRYAAPAFYIVGELETAQLQGSVVRRSGHVAPSSFGRHQVWTYQSGGRFGLPNPDGGPTAFETIDELLETIDALTGAASLDPAPGNWMCHPTRG